MQCLSRAFILEGRTMECVYVHFIWNVGGKKVCCPGSDYRTYYNIIFINIGAAPKIQYLWISHVVYGLFCDPTGPWNMHKTYLDVELSASSYMFVLPVVFCPDKSPQIQSLLLF